MASFTQQLCLLIGLGVGIDYSLFILTRTRSGLRRGLSVQDAVVNASATAGRAVLFAGITVCIALCGMFLVGVSVLSGAAIAASISVLFPMLAAQTLLPAFNGLLGKRILTRHQRKQLKAGETNPDEASSRRESWARLVQNHRLAFGARHSRSWSCWLSPPARCGCGGPTTGPIPRRPPRRPTAPTPARAWIRTRV